MSLRAFEARLVRIEADIRRLLRLYGNGRIETVTRLDPRTGSGQYGDTYVHNQLLAIEQWVVNHHMGKYPSVVTVDTSGEEMEGEVVYLDDQRVRITFNRPVAGKAFLN